MKKPIGQVSLHRFKSTSLKEIFLSASWQKDTWPVPEFWYGSACILRFWLFWAFIYYLYWYPIFDIDAKLIMLTCHQDPMLVTNIIFLSPISVINMFVAKWICRIHKILFLRWINTRAISWFRNEILIKCQNASPKIWFTKDHKIVSNKIF